MQKVNVRVLCASWAFDQPLGTLSGHANAKLYGPGLLRESLQ